MIFDHLADNPTLTLCVYSVGLASGPGFIATLRRRGLAGNALVAAALAAAVGTLVALRAVVSITAGASAGAFTGGLTNTPALAGALEALQAHLSPSAFERLGSEPVVGYSLTYPLGVLVPLIAAWLLLRRGGTGRAPLGDRVRVVAPAAQWP